MAAPMDRRTRQGSDAASKASADALVLRRRHLTCPDAQGVPRRGEVLLADDWHPDLDVVPDDAAFRIVLLARPPEGTPPAVSSPGVAVCLPATAPMGETAVREVAPAYLTRGSERDGDPFELADASRYARGSLVTVMPMPLRIDQVFPRTGAEPHLDVLAGALLEAADRARREEAADPLLPALASVLAAPQPLPPRPPEVAPVLADLSSLLAAADIALSGFPADEEGRRAAEEAIDRLRLIAAGRRPQEALLAMRALYGDALTLAEDVYLARCLYRDAPAALELAALRRYFASAAAPETMAELETDRRMSLETASFATLFHAPHRLDDMRATFDVFRKRYRAAYVAHHRRYWRSAAALHRDLRDAASTAEALERLNTLAELGRPVGEESLRRYRTLLGEMEACAVEEGLDGLLADRTACPSCSVGLADEPPEPDVRETLQGLTSALGRQQTRLSSEAVRQILAAEKGERIERFLQVVQASDLTGLANVLDDELLAFLRELLE
jgi:hypothetical protein